MSRRAARAGDSHVCPSREPAPHIGGPIQRGTPKVLIEGKPAARAGDMATCRDATDVIAEGSGTVKMGGMLAARRGDKCAHGGSVTGAAATVFIGGPTVAPPGIAAIAANAAEIDRLRRRQAERREKIRKIDDYVKKREQESAVSDGEKVVRKGVRKILEGIAKRVVEQGLGGKGDLPPGADDFTKEQATVIREGTQLKKDLEKGIDRDEKRIQELEKENGERAEGKDPKPAPPDPDLDKPIKGGPHIQDALDE